MEPKGAQSDQNGAKGEPKGAKSDQNGAKGEPKRAKGTYKGPPAEQYRILMRKVWAPDIEIGGILVSFSIKIQ